MSDIDLLTVSDAAGQYKLAKRSIQDAILRGKLPARKLSGATGAYLIKEADLREWLFTRPRS
jgi:hypothetical protein